MLWARRSRSGSAWSRSAISGAGCGPTAVGLKASQRTLRSYAPALARKGGPKGVRAPRSFHFRPDGASRPVRQLRARLGADPFVPHLFAALAEKERAMISARTKAALSAGRARGVRLGNPRFAKVPAAKREGADAFAASVEQVIRDCPSDGP
jgi:hypothetical protein